MDKQNQIQVPQCYVMVRKLTLSEISRININPFLVAHRCGRCNIVLYHGPKCTSCRTLYHFDCAVINQKCCARFILPPSQKLIKSNCGKCNGVVQFGPQCTVCQTMFHNFCITGFDRCCELPLYMPNFQTKCGSCAQFVEFGPRCPLCGVTYHISCLKDYKFGCCGIRIDSEKTPPYICSKCKKRIWIAGPICTICGNPSHPSCLKFSNKCCGKAISLDVFFVPSFSYLDKINKLNNRNIFQVKNESQNHGNGVKKRKLKKRKKPNRIKDMPKLNHTRDSKVINPTIIGPSSSFNNVNMLTDIKAEHLEVEVESDIQDEEPPLLTPEEPIQDPIPSTNAVQLPNEDSDEDSDDSLESLFYFLYKVVKKFPPALQNQVKFDLFKTVNEAETKLSNR